MQGAFDAQRKRSTVIAIALAAVAIIALGFFGFKAFGGLSAQGGTPDTDALRRSGRQPDNQVLAAASNTPTPVLNKGGEVPVPKKMPPEVFAWLKHLEQCEAMKVAISGDQAAEVSVYMQKMGVLGAGMGMQDPYDQSDETPGEAANSEPSGYAKGKILDLRPRWEELITKFNSYPPPDECKPLADDFNRAIGEIPGMMGDLGEILNGASADPMSSLQKVKKMQNSSYGDVDRYFLRSDEKLGQICGKYDTHKWFNIKGDVLAGGMMGRFGGIGGGAGGN